MFILCLVLQKLFFYFFIVSICYMYYIPWFFYILFFNVYFIISISIQLSKSQRIFKTELQNTSFLCHYLFYTYQNIFHSSSIFIYQYVHHFYSLVYTIRFYYENHNIFYIYALSWLTDMHKIQYVYFFFQISRGLFSLSVYNTIYICT